MEKSTRNWIIAFAIFLLFLFLYHGIYKMHFQFNNQDVKDYINEEAAKYPAEQRPAVIKLITDGVKVILDDRASVRQVITSARVNHTPREFELVRASVQQNKNYGYLKL